MLAYKSNVLAYKIFKLVQAVTEFGHLFEARVRILKVATQSKVTLKYLVI